MYIGIGVAVGVGVGVGVGCRDLSPQKMKENGHVLTELLKFQFFVQNTGILHYIRYTALNNSPVSIS